MALLQLGWILNKVYSTRNSVACIPNKNDILVLSVNQFLGILCFLFAFFLSWMALVEVPILLCTKLQWPPKMAFDLNLRDP